MAVDLSLHEYGDRAMAETADIVEAGLDADDPRVNPTGGAIAIGHPLGASGARLALTARRLRHTCGRDALVTMCIDVCQGIASVVERT